MKKKLTDKNEIKVFILYVMKNINTPLSYDDIMEVVFENGFVGYFDFTQMFQDLVDNGSISESPESAVYSVTEKGRVIVENLKDLLPSSVRSTFNISLAKRISLQKYNLRFFHKVEEKDNIFKFSCKISDLTKDILTLSLSTEDPITAQKAAQNFAENPESILRGLLALLAKDINYL